jgi:hypothetical protein
VFETHGVLSARGRLLVALHWFAGCSSRPEMRLPSARTLTTSTALFVYTRYPLHRKHSPLETVATKKWCPVCDALRLEHRPAHVTFTRAKEAVALAVSSGVTFNVLQHQSTLPAEHHLSLCLHPDSARNTFSRRVLHFEHLSARFCARLPCHTPICAAPPSDCSIATTRSADWQRRFITPIHQRDARTTTPHDNAIVARCTRLTTSRDCHSLIIARA